MGAYLNNLFIQLAIYLCGVQRLRILLNCSNNILLKQQQLRFPLKVLCHNSALNYYNTTVQVVQ